MCMVVRRGRGLPLSLLIFFETESVILGIAAKTTSIDPAVVNGPGIQTSFPSLIV